MKAEADRLKNVPGKDALRQRIDINQRLLIKLQDRKQQAASARDIAGTQDRYNQYVDQVNSLERQITAVQIEIKNDTAKLSG